MVGGGGRPELTHTLYLCSYLCMYVCMLEGSLHYWQARERVRGGFLRNCEERERDKQASHVMA